MKKSFSFWIYQPYKWLIVVPVFVLDTIVCAVMTVIVSMFSHVTAFCWGVWWGKVMQFITPMRVKVSGRQHADVKQSYVIMANHQSAYDIFAIYANIGLSFRWIMKSELRQAPLIGWACDKGHHIFLERSSKMAAYRSLQRAKKILCNGTSVVIFPEGTRTYSNNIGRFKSGGFKLAFQLGLPILPVTIKDTHTVMGRSFGSLKPSKAELIIHEPIDTMQYVDKQEELMEVTRNVISSAL